MKTEEIFKAELETLRNEVISTIKSHMVRIKDIVNTNDDEEVEYDEVRLSTQINIEYIDENTSESICAISFNGDNHAIIDTGLDDDELQLSEIKLEALIDVVGQLELFETYEDVEFHLM